jgi:hypothetical protein
MAPRRSVHYRNARDTMHEESTEARLSTSEASAEEEQLVWQPVWIAIFEGEFDGAFKHWAVFVEDENDAPRALFAMCRVPPQDFITTEPPQCPSVSIIGRGYTHPVCPFE